MPDWRDEIISAVDYWIGLEGGAAGTASWKPMGRVRAEAQPGWYALDIRGARINADQLDALRLAGEGTRAEDGYPVLTVVHEGELIRVQVAEFVELAQATLWQFTHPATYLQVKLRDGIAAMGDPRLGHDLARGRLTAIPDIVPLEPAFARFPPQNQAYYACLTPGLRLVWGPPGTGKTKVLARAIDTLIQAGKRVLLASSTNIAVDNALLGVLKARRYPSGTLLRVGPPHLPEVAANPEVALPHLVRQQLQEVEDLRQDLEKQILVIRATEHELSAMEQTLAGFDPDRHRRIRRQIQDLEEIPTLARAAAEATNRRQDAETALAQTAERVAATQDDWTQAAPARAAYAEVDRLAVELKQVDSATDEIGVRALLARQERDAAQRRLAEAEQASLFQRLGSRQNRKQLRAELTTREDHANELERQDRDARALTERRRQAFQEQSAALLGRAGLSRDDIARRDRAVAGARRAHESAGAACAAAERQEETARTTLLAAEAQPRPTAEDRAYVADAEDRGLRQLHARMTSVRATVAGNKGRREQLEKKHAEIQNRFEQLRRDAEGSIIAQAQLVATTLARFRITKALLEGEYDVVLVDEAGASTLPELILAVSRATSTAVLLGDFLQLGAITHTELTKRNRPDVQRWLLRDVFEHCGITTAAEAETNRGCAALKDQHRFGLDVMRLVNMIGYDGHLRDGRGLAPREPDDPEIVLIDVDGLDDLGRVRSTSASAGWWPAGALLSRVLADYHLTHGQVVGVVTPYRQQVEATVEALRDWERTGRPQTETGTAHRFQGREFPIVVFDLVEDRYDQRWVAQADRDKGIWRRDGVRLFNVAITRTQTRLYLIVSRTRIAAAAPGTPLGAVAELLRDRRIRTVPATLLIAPPTVPDTERGLGLFGSDLAAVLAQHVYIADVTDETTFYQEFTERLRTARRSLWIWAAWTASRVKSLLPGLSEARARGVDIRVFVRDDTDKLQKRADFQKYLADIRGVATSVVQVHEMHQKIVVIDEQTVLLGSLNVLSQRSTREVMLVMEGHQFARKLLEHEHAKDFATPPRCGACGGGQIDLRRTRGAWEWRCGAQDCPDRRGSRTWRAPALGHGARPGQRSRSDDKRP